MSNGGCYPGARQMDELCDKWGGARVQDAMDFIVKARDHRGILLGGLVTVDRIEVVLQATYGENE